MHLHLLNSGLCRVISFYLFSFSKMFYFFHRIAQPILLGGLISFFTPGSKMTLNEAYIWAVGVVLCSGFNVLFMHPYMMSVMHIGMKARVAACSLVYRKVSLFNFKLGDSFFFCKTWHKKNCTNKKKYNERTLSESQQCTE